MNGQELSGAPAVTFHNTQGSNTVRLQDFNNSASYEECSRQGRLAHRTLIYLWLTQDLSSLQSDVIMSSKDKHGRRSKLPVGEVRPLDQTHRTKSQSTSALKYVISAENSAIEDNNNDDGFVFYNLDEDDKNVQSEGRTSSLSRIPKATHMRTAVIQLEQPVKSATAGKSKIPMTPRQKNQKINDLDRRWALEKCEELTTWVSELLKSQGHRLHSDLRKSVMDGETLILIIESAFKCSLREGLLYDTFPTSPTEPELSIRSCLLFLDSVECHTNTRAEDILEGDLKSIITVLSAIREHSMGQSNRKQSKTGHHTKTKEKSLDKASLLPNPTRSDVIELGLHHTSAANQNYSRYKQGFSTFTTPSALELPPPNKPLKSIMKRSSLSVDQLMEADNSSTFKETKHKTAARSGSSVSINVDSGEQEYDSDSVPPPNHSSGTTSSTTPASKPSSHQSHHQKTSQHLSASKSLPLHTSKHAELQNGIKQTSDASSIQKLNKPHQGSESNYSIREQPSGESKPTTPAAEQKPALTSSEQPYTPRSNTGYYSYNRWQETSQPIISGHPPHTINHVYNNPRELGQQSSTNGHMTLDSRHRKGSQMSSDSGNSRDSVDYVNVKSNRQEKTNPKKSTRNNSESSSSMSEHAVYVNTGHEGGERSARSKSTSRSLDVTTQRQSADSNNGIPSSAFSSVSASVPTPSPRQSLDKKFKLHSDSESRHRSSPASEPCTPKPLLDGYSKEPTLYNNPVVVKYTPPHVSTYHSSSKGQEHTHQHNQLQHQPHQQAIIQTNHKQDTLPYTKRDNSSKRAAALQQIMSERRLSVPTTYKYTSTTEAKSHDKQRKTSMENLHTGSQSRVDALLENSEMETSLYDNNRSNTPTLPAWTDCTDMESMVGSQHHPPYIRSASVNDRLLNNVSQSHSTLIADADEFYIDASEDNADMKSTDIAQHSSPARFLPSTQRSLARRSGRQRRKASLRESKQLEDKILKIEQQFEELMVYLRPDNEGEDNPKRYSMTDSMTSSIWSQDPHVYKSTSSRRYNRSSRSSEQRKSTNKRFQRIESHIITLARSVAHISSELRSHNAVYHELERLAREVDSIKHHIEQTIAGDQVGTTLDRTVDLSPPTYEHPVRDDASANGEFAENKESTVQRINKLTRSKFKTLFLRRRFFGQEPPLMNIFLRKLGYEQYTELFESEKVGMLELPYMTEEKLQSLGIPLGPRCRIIEEAQHLKLTMNGIKSTVTANATGTAAAAKEFKSSKSKKKNSK